MVPLTRYSTIAGIPIPDMLKMGHSSQSKKCFRVEPVLTYMDRREGKLTKIHQAKEYRKVHSYKTMRIFKRRKEAEKQ